MVGTYTKNDSQRRRFVSVAIIIFIFLLFIINTIAGIKHTV